MTLTDIQTLLQQNRKFLQDTFGVQTIGVFGSYARQTADSESDIDLLVEFSRPIGWEIVDLQDYLETLLGKEVDLVTTKALKPQLRTAILNQVVYA